MQQSFPCECGCGSTQFPFMFWVRNALLCTPWCSTVFSGMETFVAVLAPALILGWRIHRCGILFLFSTYGCECTVVVLSMFEKFNLQKSGFHFLGLVWLVGW